SSTEASTQASGLRRWHPICFTLRSGLPGRQGMSVTFLEDPTLEAMGRYMGRLSRRQQVVASNLANIDTPGYRTKDVSFHATMEELLGADAMRLRSSQPEHVAPRLTLAPEPEVYEAQGLPVRPDGNNVDLDRELLNLSETASDYALLAQLLRSKFHTLASSINEGRTG